MNNIKTYVKFDEKLTRIANKAEKELCDIFKSYDKVKEYNMAKVLYCMRKNKLSETHFYPSTGYGYGDMGREAIDKIYADIFGAEAGIVRGQMVSGTHAIAVALYGQLMPGDELLAVTGKPYDTLDDVIGISNKKNTGSLMDYGVKYKQVDLIDGKPNFEEIKSKINDKTKMVLIQRSKGYNWRPSLSIKDIKHMIRFIKDIKKNIICFVDNCYGEFMETEEPTNVGADLLAGSLIKNPGGGLAKTGGYVVGKKDLVEKASYRLTVPGMGGEVGATLGMNRDILQGLFFAPHIVVEAVKSAIFASRLFEELGFEVNPKYNESRTDIIQIIKLKNPESLIAFCQGLQKGSPVDAFLRPEPWDMPGYNSKVIMAAGTFVQGSSIELSADAPLREPYYVYMQGGLVYEQAKIGIMYAAQELINRGLLNLSK